MGLAESTTARTARMTDPCTYFREFRGVRWLGMRPESLSILLYGVRTVHIGDKNCLGCEIRLHCSFRLKSDAGALSHQRDRRRTACYAGLRTHRSWKCWRGLPKIDTDTLRNAVVVISSDHANHALVLVVSEDFAHFTQRVAAVYNDCRHWGRIRSGAAISRLT